ncbi:amidophosphoribosyltransferase [Hirschia litorea]|uniref:Amidophosphoribosyltransferase n=1 Tax=Hirschia litorea TaxID=1199156 RepID=A0ABW2IH24_9PROT
MKTANSETIAEENIGLETASLRHKCGVFGVFGHKDAAILTALGLHALQHRGQEAAGIVSFDRTYPTDTKNEKSRDTAFTQLRKNMTTHSGKIHVEYDASDRPDTEEPVESFYIERHLGLVGDNFGKDGEAIKNLKGSAAIGHNRYSTSGGVALRNIQPIFADLKLGGFAVAHNGNLTNAETLWDSLMQKGAIFQSKMDTEVILQLTAHSKESNTIDRFLDAIKQIEGGYALVCLTNKKLIGARDPWGIRPLILGKIKNSDPEAQPAYVLASESCALEAVGAETVREIENGEVVVITRNGIKSHFPFPKTEPRPCAFEYLYFARPDSIMHGKSIYEVREEMGRQLALEHPVAADLVAPVPDGGNPAGLGYAEASKIPFKFGIIRNHYIGRTFIQPTQDARAGSVTRKHAANLHLVRGKSVILVDDSIVRGTTSKAIVAMMRNAGAKEVHFRVASPPIKHPDFYGVDMPTEAELLASRMSIEEMTQWLGVDSLGFLSIEGFYKALGEDAYDPENPKFADHCFTNNYPTVLTDKRNAENKIHQQNIFGRDR